jgi:hypothetical protein
VKQPLQPEVRDTLAPDQVKRLRSALVRERIPDVDDRIALLGFAGSRRVRGSSAARAVGHAGVNRLARFAILVADRVWDGATCAAFPPLGLLVWWGLPNEVFVEPVHASGWRQTRFGLRHPLCFQVNRDGLASIGESGWPVVPMKVEFSYSFASLCGRAGVLRVTPDGKVEAEEFWVS